MNTLRHLIVGTDFSANADAALDFAIDLAKLGAAAITLVHVCEPTEEHGLGDPASEEDVLQSCRVQLLATCARRSHTGVSIVPVLRSGQAADKIHNVATEVGASMIVIGRCTRGRLGHTAERVLHTASRPVLAITIGFIYALADLVASIVHKLDGDPTRIPQQSNASDSMVVSQRKGNVMNKIIFTTVAGLILSTSTSLADNDRLGHGMQPVSDALEITIGGGYMRSGGDIGRNMAGVDDLTRNGGGAELSVGYRMSPQLSIGLYGTLSGYQVGDAVAPTTDLAIGSTLGVKADWHFRPAMAVDPWVSIGTGWRGLWIGNDANTERAYHGLELTRVQLGVDYRITPTFALAPYLGASAAMFLAEDTMTSNGYDEIASNEVNFSFTAGLMARFDLPFGAR